MVQFAQHLKGNVDKNISFMGRAGKMGVLGFHLFQFYYECFPFDAVLAVTIRA